MKREELGRAIYDIANIRGEFLSSVAALRSQGALIETVLCVIAREAGGKKNLEAAGLAIRPLFSKSELESLGGGTYRYERSKVG